MSGHCVLNGEEKAWDHGCLWEDLEKLYKMGCPFVDYEEHLKVISLFDAVGGVS